jgi:azurin
MLDRRASTMISCAVVVAILAGSPSAETHLRHHQDPSTPRILLDQPLRAVEYQLGRLSDEELVLVDRKVDDVRYRPVYLALLTRKGLAPQFRDEALAAIAAMDKTTRSRVLLEALGKVPAEDDLTAGKLIALLLGVPATSLRQERETFARAIDTSTQPAQPAMLRGAYSALMVGDGKPDQAWQAALSHEGHMPELLRSVPYLASTTVADKTEALRGLLFTPISTLAREAKDVTTRAEALAALGWTRADTTTFELLAQAVTKGTDAEVRNAAIRSLQVLPESAWPTAAIEPLARSIVGIVTDTVPDLRTEPAILDAIQFGERLAAKLPSDAGRALRRDLRALGVQVVRIQAIPEKLSFDLKWFAVEAGKPVQIVLFNPDAMPHNLIVSKPGSLQEVGTSGGAMPMPTDPEVKAFVPDSPLVLYATKLIKEGETVRLGFTAPKEAGEYVYVCTFPGHWVRMYGVMLVVQQLDSWETSPTIPVDPMTNKPFTSQRH